MGKWFHAHLDIEGVLKNHDLNQWRGACHGDEGNYLSPDEIRERFKANLAQGVKVLPVGYTEKECPDFDYAGGACPGHEVKPDE